MHTSHAHLGIHTRPIISSSNKIYHLNSTEFVCRVHRYSVCCQISKSISQTLTSSASNAVEIWDVIETLEFVLSCIIQAQ